MSGSTVLVSYKKLNEEAIPPMRMSPGSAGYDLAVPRSIFLEPNVLTRIPTGIALDTPPGIFALLIARSSMEYKWGIAINTGLIDSDYRGEIFILARNLNSYRICIEHGRRIAQLVFQRNAITSTTNTLKLVESISETDRNEGGFGSTDPPLDYGLHCSNQGQYFEEGYAIDETGFFTDPDAELLQVVGRANSCLNESDK